MCVRVCVGAARGRKEVESQNQNQNQMRIRNSVFNFSYILYFLSGGWLLADWVSVNSKSEGTEHKRQTGGGRFLKPILFEIATKGEPLTDECCDGQDAGASDSQCVEFRHPPFPMKFQKVSKDVLESHDAAPPVAAPSPAPVPAPAAEVASSAPNLQLYKFKFAFQNRPMHSASHRPHAP